MTSIDHQPAAASSKTTASKTPASKTAASKTAASETAASAAAKPRTIDPTLKLVLEFGPLVCFFIASYRFGLYVATAVLMVGVVAALIVSFALIRRVPVMPVVTAVMVLVFGALTFYFNDPVFIKIKPTVINCLFGLALLGGLAFGKPLLPILLDTALHLDEDGWRKLTFRWGLFFFVLAGLNEFVWRTQSDVFWSGFKVFGTMPLTILFALSQVPLILRHETKTTVAQEEHF